MKEWWNQLALREKKSLIVGAGILILLLIYLVIFTPLTHKAANLRDKIKRNQELLFWMQKTDQQIRSTEKTSQPKITTDTSSLLTVVQHELQKTSFAANLTQLRQAESDSVQLSFNNVEFDKLIAWLTQLWQEHGFSVTQMTTAATTTPGIVSTDFILKEK